MWRVCGTHLLFVGSCPLIAAILVKFVRRIIVDHFAVGPAAVKVTFPWGTLVIRHSLFFVAIVFCLMSFAAESHGRLVRVLVRDGSCHCCWEHLDVG